MRRKKDKSNGITALYERLSRDDDNAGESNSIVHQKQMLEDYAMKHGFTNLVHFTDDGWSGATFDRPSWNRLVEGVKNGEITACICKDMERYCFRVLLDYYRLLCRWKEDYAPQTPEDGYHPRFVEALQKLPLVEYLLDELLCWEMQARASVVIEYGEEVRKLEQRMADIAAADEAAAQNAGGQYSIADEH